MKTKFQNDLQFKVARTAMIVNKAEQGHATGDLLCGLAVGLGAALITLPFVGPFAILVAIGGFFKGYGLHTQVEEQKVAAAETAGTADLERQVEIARLEAQIAALQK